MFWLIYSIPKYFPHIGYYILSGDNNTKQETVDDSNGYHGTKYICDMRT